MRKFETLLILSPELSSEPRATLIDHLKSIIERDGGKVLLEDHWGMRELAYPVKKQMRGYYFRFEYLANASFIAEFERNIRISDGIFKFLTVKLEDNAEEVA